MSSQPVVLARVLGDIAWPTVSLELAVEAEIFPPPAGPMARDSRNATSWPAPPPALFAGLEGVPAGQGRGPDGGENIDRSTSAMVPLVEAGARVGVVQGLDLASSSRPTPTPQGNVIRWTGALDHVPVWTAPRFAAVFGVDVGVALP